MPNRVDPNQMKKLMRSALANPFEKTQDLSRETSSIPIGSSGLSSAKRESFGYAGWTY